MKKQHQRGFLVTAGALITSALLALGGATAANAETVLDMPKQSGIIITKLEQRTPAGEAATGLQIDTADLPDAIPGVTFEAYEVPVDGFDKGTNDWQRAIAAVKLDQAQDLIDSDTPVRTGVTDENGQIFWQGDVVTATTGDLPWGLYLIRETGTPDNVVASGDFLVAVPLTNPLTLENGEYVSGLTSWLENIYIYPKNAMVEGEKRVENATDFVVGDTVTWTIDAAIPAIRDHGTGLFVPTDRFEILDTLTDAQLTLDASTDSVNVIVPEELEKGNGVVDDEAEADYFVVLDLDDVEGTTTVQIIFTAQGRQALADALKASSSGEADVTVTLETVVNSVGEIENAAIVHPGGESSYEIKPATVKYGSINLVKSSVGSTDEDEVDLSGAEFMVFLSEDDAIAAVNGDPDALAKALKPETGNHEDGVWTTGENGEVSIAGLRYSDYANGKPLVEGVDPEFQVYWLVETKALAGHQLLAEPYDFRITAASTVGTSTLDVENQFNTGGFVLPLTGGMGTAFLTIGGIAILAAVLLVARSRRNDEVTAE